MSIAADRDTSYVLADAIDGDSVSIVGDRVRKVRIAGIDTPSRGPRAKAAIRHIATRWAGRTLLIQETCCGRPHGETPARVLDRNTGASLGEELVALGFADRYTRFPI